MAAWSLFQEIEQAGGAAAALEQGLIQAKVAAVRAEREKAIAQRRDALTGTSEFPDIAEAPVDVLAPFPLAPSFSLAGERHRPSRAAPSPSPRLPSGYGEGRGEASAQGGGEKIAPLPCGRLAEPFEALRDASDRVLEQTGARPKVFLANLGDVADFMARATYAKNFFEVGGIAAVTNDGFGSREEMLAAFKASGASLACLCASDARYAVDAAEIATALRAAGATHISLAGRPGELEAALRSAGVDTFIYAGCDVVATLTAAHAIVGVA
jgi:methylmalonyl-CoA mutase